MRRYRIWHPLWMSFYSRDLYRDVARQWSGVGLLYLLLLLALVWIPTIVVMHVEFTGEMMEKGKAVLSNLPTLVIENGEASTAVPMPHEILDPDTGDVILVVDTTGEVSSLEETEATFLVTKRSFHVRQTGGRSRALEFAALGDMEITPDLAVAWWTALMTWMAALMYPLMLLGSYGYRMVEALLFGGVGLLLAKTRAPGLAYIAAVRIAAVALTPVIILQTASDLLGVAIPVRWLLSLFVILGYLYFGVDSSGDDDSAVTPGPVDNAPIVG